MKKWFPALAILVAMMSSGCTIPLLNIEIPGLPDFPGLGPTVVQYEHDVIIISSFEALPSEIDAGQTSRLLAYVENIGEETVENVEVDLYDYCKGLFTPRIVTCGDKEIAYAEGIEKTNCEIPKILAGQTVPVIWSVCQNRADPVKVRTQCPKEGMKMLVKYPYHTWSVTTIELIDLEEMQRELTERTYKSVESYIGIGQGPIKPYLTVEDKQPVPVFDIDPGGTYTDPNVPNARTVLKLVLKNMGSGQLDTVIDKDGRKVIGIKGSDVQVKNIGPDEDLRPIEPAEEECKFASSAWNEEVIRLVGKESSSYICKIGLWHLKGDVTKPTSRHIEVDISYDYVVTKNTMLVVNPKTAT
jgi:hypothetical protein